MPKMIVSRNNMKRKRKVDRSLILEDSPKRTKVHAQRKFAQGSNVNSPVLTPVEELEKPEGSGTRLVPDPVELLPIKRPNTEDFLTFLCFRGTPLLPPSLNFFNTASIVDTNGQVHEIKSESPKNGPIDTSIIAKAGCGSSDRPFIAFGVRKRADPVVISRQMDKKRRHALALQALRRKYQEQKMAKIRAVTISKLSEKVTNKTLVRTNSVSKTGTVTKKSTVQKTKVIATKRVKVITRTVKTTLRPKIQPKMCLRSFRGRFVQKELPFRNRNIRKKPAPTPVRRIIKKVEEKKVVIKKNRRSMSSEFSSEDNEPLVTTTVKEIKRSPKVLIPKIDKLLTSRNKLPEITKRVTRSENVKNTTAQKRQQKKKRILISTTTTPLVKVRNLRSQAVTKSGSKTKPKRVVLVNEKVTSVKSPKTSKLIVKSKPRMKKPVNISDRVLRSPQRITKQLQLQRTTRRLTRTQKITNIKSPRIVKKPLHKPVAKKGKIVEPPLKKTDKNIDKKAEDGKVDSQTEKLSQRPLIKKEKILELSLKKAEKNVDKKAENTKTEVQDQTDKPVHKPIAKKEKVAEPPPKKTEKNVDKKAENSKVEIQDQTDKPLPKSVTKKEKVVEGALKKSEKNADKKAENSKVEILDQTDKPLPKSVTKKEKIVEPPPKKAEKNSDKKAEGAKVEIQDQSEKSPVKVVKKIDKTNDNDKKVSDRVPKVSKESSNKDKKLVVEETISTNEKSEEKHLKKRGKGDDSGKESITKAIVSHSLTAGAEGTGTDKSGAKKETTKVKSSTELKPDKVKPSQFQNLKEADTKLTKKPAKSKAEMETTVSGAKQKPQSDEKTKLSSKADHVNQESLLKSVMIKKSKVHKTYTENELHENTSEILLIPENIDKIIEKPEIKTETVGKNDSTETKNVKVNEKVLTKTEKKEKQVLLEKQQPPNISEKNKKVGKKIVPKTVEKVDIQKKEASKVSKDLTTKTEEPEQKTGTGRPSRKTKEAAAIYMEILSHKLVNESKIDDDNISIDSFPELPNVKKTEQRENEFRAKSSQKGAEEYPAKTKPLTKEQKPQDNDEKLKQEEPVIRPRKGGSKRFPTTLNKVGNKVAAKDEKKEDKDATPKNLEVQTSGEKLSLETQKDLPEVHVNVSGDGGTANKKRKKKIVEKSVDIDEERIKEEIMREIQEKFGPYMPSYKEPKKKECAHVVESVITHQPAVSKRRSLLSDEEESESIENIRKKLKTTTDKITNIVIERAVETKVTEEVNKDINRLETKSSLEEISSVLKNKSKSIDKTNSLETKSNLGEDSTVTKDKPSVDKLICSETKLNLGEVCSTIKTKSKLVDKINNTANLKKEESALENVDNSLATHIKEVEIVSNDINQSNTTKKIIDQKVQQTACESEPKIADVSELSNKSDKKQPSVGCVENIVAEADIKLHENVKVEKHNVESTKKFTKNLTLVKNKNNKDADESFAADIKISQKKLLTRDKAPKPQRGLNRSEESNEEEKGIDCLLRKPLVPEKSESSGDSDHSTTSQPDKKEHTPGKTKKYTKTKSKLKVDHFSDSDEEPLSKLTTHVKPSNPKSEEVESNIKYQSEKLTDSNDAAKKSTKSAKDAKLKQKSQKHNTESEESHAMALKPKRECTKRPQNYLPMFSSSEDEDRFFYGFDVKKNKEKPAKAASVDVPSQPTTDLSSKDIGRRFGKGKVNMSNEQIEQWLKDSVLAGNSIKKEDDEMLKFGEKIPTETTLELTHSIDTQQLKSSLLLTTDDKKEEKPKQPAPKLLSPSSEKIKLSFSTKNQSLDKKLIFRKEKISTTPNVNAFSANNESSVYAFGEENEDVISTPFRRPVRRPSSTATSKSEEEGKGEDVVKIGQFRRPPMMKPDPKLGTKDPATNDDVFNLPENIVTAEDSTNTASSEFVPNKLGTPKETTPTKTAEDKAATTSMIPPTNTVQKTKYGEYRSLKLASRSFDRASETSEEGGKYKVPSSPSASSSSSAKLYKRQPGKAKVRNATEVCSPVSVPSFPNNCYTPMLVEAPTFYPVDKEFQDPLEYIEKIRHKAEEFGICRIIPPASFKPECKVTDDMRFTAYNQYVHKMLHRWGPNFKEFMAIKKYLKTQNITLVHSPWIGGMEIDLPRLYQTVQSLGGLKEVIEKKKWPRVSEMMKIPKSAQDRVTKLDDIYCKYLLPYDTLSPAEREKLFDEVETEWAKRESKTLLKLQQNLSVQQNTIDSDAESDNEIEECIVKGRNMALNAFYRIARNTMSVWFKNIEPTPQEVEQEFWKHVTQKQNHICVHSGSIDSGSWGYGFAVSKNSPFARNAWNLKVLTNNSGSVLRSLGPIMGVTVPTLHVGMVFSACCWYRDPHSLPWIEYLHTGGSKIWYGIPDSAGGVFHTALAKLVPNYCKNKTFWLASDTAMVPPALLVENGVSLCRTVQQPGQFVVVFPKAFTSSVSTGYVVSESVYFAPPYWLRTAQKVFNDMRLSCESSMFSLDRLLLSIANDNRSSVDVLRLVLPLVKDMCDKEGAHRTKLTELGLSVMEKLPPPEAPNARKRKKLHGEEGDYECEICRMNLFISMVVDTQENGLYCIEHAIELVENKKILIGNCKLLYTYDDEELKGLTDKINAAIENKLQKKIPNKYYGMPTLLKS